MQARPDLFETRRTKWVIRSCRCGLCKRSHSRTWQALPPEGAWARPRVFDSWAEALEYVQVVTATAEVQGPPDDPLMVPARRWFLPPAPWPDADRPFRRGRLGLWR